MPADGGRKDPVGYKIVYLLALPGGGQRSRTEEDGYKQNFSTKGQKYLAPRFAIAQLTLPSGKFSEARRLYKTISDFVGVGDARRKTCLCRVARGLG